MNVHNVKIPKLYFTIYMVTKLDTCLLSCRPVVCVYALPAIFRA